MPYVDGRKVAARIRQLGGQMPIIMLTGWGHRLIATDDKPEHVDRVLSKPPKMAELRSTLAELVRPEESADSLTVRPPVALRASARSERNQQTAAVPVSASEVHAIHSRCGSTFGETMPRVNAVTSSATKDCAEAAVPRAAGNRSSMRSVSTGNANCAPIAAQNSSACCSGIGSWVERSDAGSRAPATR